MTSPAAAAPPARDLDRAGPALLHELHEYRGLCRLAGIMPEIRDTLDIVRDGLRRQLVKLAQLLRDRALRAGRLILALITIALPQPPALPAGPPPALDRPRGMTPPIRAVLVRAVATAAPPRALPFPAGAAS